MDNVDLLAVSRRIEADLDLHGWDQPPRLYGILPSGETLEVFGFSAMCDDAHPVSGLDRLTARGRRMCYLLPRQLLPTSQLAGWTVTVETWKVNTPLVGPQASEVLTDAYARRLHARPDRIECRLVLAVDRQGRLAIISHDRGTDPIEIPMVGGEVPAALARLMQATP